MRVMSGAPMGRATKASDVLTQASRDVEARGGAVWSRRMLESGGFCLLSEGLVV